jgi:hypothetical protein
LTVSPSWSTAVLAGQADRAAAETVDPPHQLLVERAAEDHLDHLERGVVGDPHASFEPGGDAEPVEQRGDLLAAAVDHHDVDADPRQEDHILGEALAQGRVLERGAADLDHDPPATELLDERQRLDQHPRLVDDFTHVATG